jgi:glycosyltransferase involved in cell wall biosynthesis
MPADARSSQSRLNDERIGIIYCSPYYNPAEPSGANRRFNELCTRFDGEFGNRFELIVAKDKRPSGLAGAVVHEIDYKPKSLLSRLKAQRQIAGILNDRPPSLFINEFLPVPFRSVGRHCHFQVVYDLRHFTNDQTYFYRLRHTLPRKREWGRSQCIVTCSDFTRSELSKYCRRLPDEILISYFGINDDLLHHTEHAVEAKDIDILFVGHFEMRKNHANLLKAIALINPELRVTLIGVDNGLKQRLETLALQLKLTNTKFFSVNDDHKLWSYYRRSRLFVSPSNYEGFGIPVIEAMALGTPVACSNIPIFREVGQSAVTYFNQTDPDDMARVIENALYDGRPLNPKESRRLLGKFSWDTIYDVFVEDLFAFYSKVD